MMNTLVHFSHVEEKIINLRNENVILDSDVAQLYGVETMRINEAVKNNPDKFPEGYVIRLTKEEKKEVIEIFDNLSKLRFSPVSPKAFTERGLYMLATILKGERAIQTTLDIIETFAKMRELARTVTALATTAEPAEQAVLTEKSGYLIADLLEDELIVTGTDTSIELNLPLLKIKHTVHKEKKKK